MKRADPQRALLRALAIRYPGLCVDDAKTEAWASATFTGARHVLACAGADVSGIEEAEFSLPGHLVADIAARQENSRLIIEALTIEID
ncbi:MAG: hypothetical protein JSS55_09100 [Proteobacteria bacterium]|nr:hypothetical protein [Pseudomonadota bacterium]